MAFKIQQQMTVYANAAGMLGMILSSNLHHILYVDSYSCGLSPSRGQSAWLSVSVEYFEYGNYVQCIVMRDASTVL